MTELQVLEECAGQRARIAWRGRFAHANAVKRDPRFYLAVRGR